jgi:hypothetical protein
MLLQLDFGMVYSEALEETVLFAKDDDTWLAVVEAGAESASVYTREEVRVLVRQHRRAPITAGR